MRTTHQALVVRPVEDFPGEAQKNQDRTFTAGTVARERRLIEAAMLLGTMFDQAMVRANRARAREGWSSVIGERHHVGERCYYAPAPHGAERTLRLFITLPLLDGDLFGGAYVKPTGAHSAIYVVPVIGTEPARWLVQISGEELTAPMIDDLFRATFSDDMDAATRLGPLYGFDLFATPWS